MFRALIQGLFILLLSVGSAVADIQLYPIGDLKLPEIDDGTGPLKFDFGPFKIASRYDGQTCAFSIRRFVEQVEEIGKGQFLIELGHLNFRRSIWLTGGLAKPETFKRANLALTEGGELVGRLPVFNLFVGPGELTPDAHLVTVRAKDGKLGKEVPLGSIKLEIERDMKGEFVVTRCVPS